MTARKPEPLTESEERDWRESPVCNRAEYARAFTDRIIATLGAARERIAEVERERDEARKALVGWVGSIALARNVEAVVTLQAELDKARAAIPPHDITCDECGTQTIYRAGPLVEEINALRAEVEAGAEIDRRLISERDALLAALIRIAREPLDSCCMAAIAERALAGSECGTKKPNAPCAGCYSTPCVCRQLEAKRG